MEDEFLNEITNQKHLPYHLPSAKNHVNGGETKRSSSPSYCHFIILIPPHKDLSVSHAQSALFHSILDEDKSKIILIEDY